MSRFVRQSKYRHVFGQEAKSSETYTELNVTRSAWDSNLIDANPYFFSLCWHSGGGGLFAVIPYGNTGKIGHNTPLFDGHKGKVLDTKFSPFNDYLVASASEDCTVKIWEIPEGGLTENITTPAVSLAGHGRKVGHLLFHPHAENVLVSNSTDLTFRFWDIQTGSEQIRLTGHSDMILDMSFDAEGALMCSVSKDKKLKIWDPRAGESVAEGPGHQGVKGARCVWLGSKNQIITVGFSKRSQRQYAVHDPRDLSTPLAHKDLDTSSGIIMPFWDDDSGVLFLAGKGDGNIRYFEMVDEDPWIFSLSEHRSNVPQRGMCALPKRAVDVSNCEIMRLMKVTNDAVTPISMRVPRKADTFQEDLFPDTAGGEPGLQADAWFAGENNPVPLVSLRDGFVETERKTFTPSAEASATAAGASASGPSSLAEYREAYTKQQQEIAELTARVAARDAKIISLEAQLAEAQSS